MAFVPGGYWLEPFAMLSGRSGVLLTHGQPKDTIKEILEAYGTSVEEMDVNDIREVFEAAGEDAINLGLGQPDFPTPEHAREAAMSAIQDGMGDSYTSNKGIPELERPSVPLCYRHRHDIPAENIIATADEARRFTSQSKPTSSQATKYSALTPGFWPRTTGDARRRRTKTGRTRDDDLDPARESGRCGRARSLLPEQPDRCGNDPRRTR